MLWLYLAAHDDEAIRRPIQRREFLEHRRRRPLWVLLVHAIQERQLHDRRIDQNDLVAASGE